MIELQRGLAHIGGILDRASAAPRPETSATVRIQVNGDERETSATTVLELVLELSLDPKKVAVERNLEIVPRSLHETTALDVGDRIELVQFVGGG